MGKTAEFNILLASNRQVFYPGEQMAGSVVLNLHEPMDMKGLYIECYGSGYCHWTEQSGSGENKRTEDYSGNESLFTFNSFLFGNGSTKIKHPCGRFEYQFMFTLPAVLPSSFEGHYGHIRYELKAQIIRPWRFDIKIKRPVIINELIDTNQPSYATGPGGEVHKEVGCLCCAAGPLNLSASLDRAAYCPGEHILINAQVQNNTSRNMTALKAKLVQNVQYHSSRKTKSNVQTIAKLAGPSIPKREFANWSNEPFAIPATCPTILTSGVITVSYHVVINVEVPMGTDLKITVPVTFGTVPFRRTYGQPPVRQPVEAASFVPSNFAPPPANILGYPDMAPPSYAAVAGEAAVNIADDQHTGGQLTYTPVYTFAQPYQFPAGTGVPYPPPSSSQGPPPQIGFSHYPASPQPNTYPEQPYPEKPHVAPPYPQSLSNRPPYPENLPNAPPYPAN